MKKLIYGAVAALLIGFSSCDKASNEAGTLFSEEATDSLLISFGQTAGYSLNNQVAMALQSDPSFTKEAFLKGVQYAMAADTSDAYINGVRMGLQFLNNLNSFRQMGADVDNSVALNAFKAAFMSDSVPSQMELTKIDGTFRQWVDSLQKAKRSYELRQLETSEEAVRNAAEGEKYIAERKAENDSVKVSASGLGYKIVSEGEGDKLNPRTRAKVTYTAKTPDGRIVERMNGGTFTVSSRVPGLQEGLQMLGKGGKAVLYVPGKLAYGLAPSPNLGIGLNELIIYDVTVEDVPETTK